MGLMIALYKSSLFSIVSLDKNKFEKIVHLVGFIIRNEAKRRVCQFCKLAYYERRF